MAVITKDLGAVTAYAAAVNRGYTGTKEEFETLMASYATVAQQAQASATSAGQSATDASGSAQTASTASTAAQQAQTAAETAQTQAQGYAQSAQASAQDAQGYAQSAESAKDTAVDAVDGFAAGAQQALDSVNSAGNNWKSLAQAQKLDAEAWAVGQRDGADVGSSDETYHNNAKYYAEQTAGSSSQIIADATAQKVAAQQARQGAETAQGLAETAQTAAEAAQTAAETAQGKAEEAAERADVVHDGTYDDMTAGSAKQLISSKYSVDAEPYTFRASGGNGADREYDKIVGGSIVWNQLYQIRNASYTDKGLTAVASEDRSIFTINGTTTATGGAFSMGIKNVKDHIYYYHGHLSDATSMYFSAQAFGSDVNNNGKIVKSTSTNATWWYVFTIKDSVAVGTVIENVTARPQVIDLTQMFGSEIADYIYGLETATPDAGVAWFRKLFPKDYYEYNAGELMHVSDLQSHDMVGFNAWDEEWEVGGINASSGANTTSLTLIRSKNYIPVLPGTTYYEQAPDRLTIFYYDKDKAFISYQNRTNQTFTTPVDCHYVRFFVKDTYGTTYNHDICINLSGMRNGEYEPYVRHSYPLDSSLTLRGVPKLDANNQLYCDGDIYEPDGTVTRKYGIVDLGTLSLRANGTPTEGVYQYVVTVEDKAYGKTNFFCGGFAVMTNAAQTDNWTMVGRDANNIVAFNIPYATVEDATAAMSGVYLVYELATATAETADPYQSLQIVDPYGTEEYVTTGIVPVGHETKYPENLRAKIEGLPWDFSSLIAPTETGKASRNYTIGSLLIMGNVLYKVTANIANGGTITPNTNVTATTLSEVISALA